MKILALAATISRGSINQVFVSYAAKLLQQDITPTAEVTFVDLNDYEMPIYSIDRERETGIPGPAQDLFTKIGAVDGVLISFAEHNGSTTAAWKNVFDWMSRIEMKVFQGKPMVMLAASPGGRAGAGVLGGQQTILPHFGAEIVATLGIGSWGKAWDADTQTLTRPEDVTALGHALSALSPNAVEKE